MSPNTVLPSYTAYLFLFTGLAATAGPLVIALVLGFKKKLRVRPFLFGLLSFFVSQILLRTQILKMFSGWEAFLLFQQSILGIILIGGLSAGLFEESSRWVLGRFVLKGHTSFSDAVSFGLGHSFCEIAMIVGLSNLSSAMYCFMEQNGLLAPMLAAQGVTSAQISGLIAALASATPFSAFLAILERCSTTMFHVFATVLVFKGINTKKIGYWIAAVLFHTLTNSLSVLIGATLGITVSEIVLLAMAAAMLVYVLRARKNFPSPDTAALSLERRP